MGCSSIGYAAANDDPHGGAAPYYSLDVNVTGLVVKASPGRVYGWHIASKNAAATYVKFYDKATAPTQADTPKFVIQVPITGAVSFSLPPGIQFANGIAIRGTTSVADNGTGAPAANDIVASIFYA